MGDGLARRGSLQHGTRQGTGGSYDGVTSCNRWYRVACVPAGLSPMSNTASSSDVMDSCAPVRVPRRIHDSGAQKRTAAASNMVNPVNHEGTGI